MKGIRTEVKYAFFSAVALIAWVVAEHLLGYMTTKMEIGEYTEPLIAIPVWLLLFLGIWEKKSRDLTGHFSFGKGLQTALLISFLYALLQSVWFAFYTHIINPDYATLALVYKEKQLAAEGKEAQQISDELAYTRILFRSASLQFLFFTVSTTVINTIAGAIMSFFLRTKTNNK
ncbi:MAG: DUF4199 domain-containing protein [Chitinophagaceae bacterium]|nr:DUF4199 domain-containing protein [Chitinophagaceae bacterium]